MPRLSAHSRPRIGVRREDKNDWERRVPLTPDHVKKLVQQGYDVHVQPSKIRAFSDREYEASGATVQEDLSSCNMVFAIKEIPSEFFWKGGRYMFFAHVIKGQRHNMPMLKRMLELGCTLLDYERVVDDKNRRLIPFGNYAGLAGMIETFYTLGKRLEWEGMKTPFLALRRPLEYGDLGEARAALEVVAKWIAAEGLPEKLSPFVVGFAGYGNVSKGAQEIFDIMPHEDVSPANLDAFMKTGKFSRNKLYKVVFYEKDMVVPANKNASFDLQGYYQHPEKYRGTFEQYLPHLTSLVNCIYWDARYPRLVTKKWLRENWNKNSRLKVIGDVSCDIEGSVECTLDATDPGNPIFTYLPKEDKAIDGFKGDGPVVMAVDTLPSELPKESSAFFADMLMPFIPDIMAMDPSASLDKVTLPPELMKALIVYKGKLTPEYEYISKHLQ